MKHLIKRYLVWMILSYVVVGGLVYIFVFIPQRKGIEKHRVEKAEIEYEYLKITSSPAFIKSLDTSIWAAVMKTRDYEWVDSDSVDAGLTFYNYIYGISKKVNLELLELSKVESSSSKQAQKAKIYHMWRVKFAGGFTGVLSLVDEVEHNRKFLAVEEISIARGRAADSQTVYEVVFLAIKKDAADAKKTQI